MTPRRRRRLALVVILMVGVSAAVALMLTAFRGNLMYFYQPSAVVAGKVPEGVRVRIGGLVKPGSIHRSEKGLQIRFMVVDCGAAVPVHYKGLLPTLFGPGQGVVASGYMRNGVFVADDILAKHDASYMPPEVAAATQTPSGESCMPVEMAAY